MRKVKYDAKNFNKQKKIDTMMRTAVSPKIEELQQEGIQAYKEKMARESALVEAYNNKKLKSQRLIKQARRILSNRNETAEKTE